MYAKCFPDSKIRTHGDLRAAMDKFLREHRQSFDDISKGSKERLDIVMAVYWGEIEPVRSIFEYMGLIAEPGYWSLVDDPEKAFKMTDEMRRLNHEAYKKSLRDD